MWLRRTVGTDKAGEAEGGTLTLGTEIDGGRQGPPGPLRAAPAPAHSAGCPGGNWTPRSSSRSAPSGHTAGQGEEEGGSQHVPGTDYALSPRLLRASETRAPPFQRRSPAARLSDRP